jgi:hypothetical protein
MIRLDSISIQIGKDRGKIQRWVLQNVPECQSYDLYQVEQFLTDIKMRRSVMFLVDKVSEYSRTLYYKQKRAYYLELYKDSEFWHKYLTNEEITQLQQGLLN